MSTPTTSHARSAATLVAVGAALFTLGLLTGFGIPAVSNPRMGLAAHLEGVMNGTFLIALGAVWSRLLLPVRAERAAFWLLLYGSVANWVFVMLAAIFGTSRATPMAGAGHVGAPWQEALITAGLVSVGLTMLAGMLLATWGFFRGRRQPAMP
jgi:(hydroxyamino)benzene mutase